MVNMLAVYVVGLLIGITASSAVQRSVCDDVPCDVEEKCFVWPSDPEQAVCAAFTKEGVLQGSVVVNGHKYWLEYNCPVPADRANWVNKVTGRLLNCGIFPVDLCDADTACGNVDEGCCFDGCSNVCKKLEVKQIPAAANRK